MSKQSEAKAAQGYTKNPACCKTCQNFSSRLEEELNISGGIWWIKESHKRCDIGGFAVQSSAYCSLYVLNSK